MAQPPRSSAPLPADTSDAHEALVRNIEDSVELDAALRRLPLPDLNFHRQRLGRPIYQNEVFLLWADDWRDASRLLKQRGLVDLVGQTRVDCSIAALKPIGSLLTSAHQLRRKHVAGFLRRLTEPATPEVILGFALRVSIATDAAKAWVSAKTAAQEDAGKSKMLVQLGGPAERVIVRGKVQRKLTKAQRDVIEALLAAGSSGLTKDQLVSQSGHGDAVGVLKRLRAKSPEWRAVIGLAEVTGGGYRISCQG